ncbi:MAG TPA: hypothetical protein VJR71_00800 [Pseudolabrys sp.]|nr:hypothetical protein [Pseudolabrys sp.]
MSRGERIASKPNANFGKTVSWFLFLFAIWSGVLYWQSMGAPGYAGADWSEPEYQLLLRFASPVGALFVLALMLADRATHGPDFPRNAVTFALLAAGLNLLVLVIAILVGGGFRGLPSPGFLQFVKGLLPFVAVSAIAIVRNFMRALRVWAFTE